MKKIDMTGVQEVGEFSRPGAGAYICEITNVEDLADKEYLKIDYDIAKGEFAGYYTIMREDHPDWGNVGVLRRSYKQAALPFFKRFCSAVSKSNGNYIFDGGNINADESTLIGKKIGLVFQEEEYYGNDGNKRIRLNVYKEFPIDQLDKQKTPPCKKLAEPAIDGFNSLDVAPGEDSENPFN